MRELHPVTESLREGESIWMPPAGEGGWGIVYNAEGVACRMLWFGAMTAEEIERAQLLASGSLPEPEGKASPDGV